VSGVPPDGVDGSRREGVGDELEVARLVLRRDVLVARVGRLGLRREVEEVDEQVRARHAVDGGVVHLGDHPDPAALEPLGQPHLPQGAAAVELAARHVGGEVAQLADAAGGGERGPPHVQVDVEVGVVEPDRVVEVERHWREPPAELGDEVHPLPQEVLHLLERVAARHRGGVEDHERRHVHVVGRRLPVEEGRVEAAQSLHDVSLSRWGVRIPAGMAPRNEYVF
jgi:hypothetical protein